MSVSRRAGGEPGVNLFRIAKNVLFLAFFENKINDKTRLLWKEVKGEIDFLASIYRALYLGIFGGS